MKKIDLVQLVEDVNR